MVDRAQYSCPPRALDRKGIRKCISPCARSSSQTDAAQIADADFLAGWIALRFLNQPSVAAEHFAFMLEHVNSVPPARPRAAYWRARAAEALSEPAEDWLQPRRALQKRTFYGQLATEKLHRTRFLCRPNRNRRLRIRRISTAANWCGPRVCYTANTSGPGRSESVSEPGWVRSRKTPGGQALTARLAREFNADAASRSRWRKSTRRRTTSRVLYEGYPVLADLRFMPPRLNRRWCMRSSGRKVFSTIMRSAPPAPSA